MTLTYILSRAVFQLLRSSGQITAFDKAVPLVNAFVLGNLCEYHHKSYFFGLKFHCRHMGLSSTTFT